jgi:hypothetical protein
VKLFDISMPNASMQVRIRSASKSSRGTAPSCRGWSGVSPLTSGATLTADRAVKDASAVNVAQMILSGANRLTPEGVLFMPAFASAYSDTEIAAVANYVTGRFGSTPSHLTARDVAKFRRLSSQ